MKKIILSIFTLILLSGCAGQSKLNGVEYMTTKRLCNHLADYPTWNVWYDSVKEELNKRGGAKECQTETVKIEQ